MIECVVDAGAELGECPVWDDERRCLYWVDSTAGKIHSYDPATGATASWSTPGPVGSIGLCRGGGLVAALKSGFALYEPGSTQPVRMVTLDGEPESNRLNDGRVDPAGRFWVGSMTGPARQPVGSLFSFDANLNVERKLGGLTISNSLCWSPDGATMYHGDSPSHTVWAWDFDVETGAISNRRIFADRNVLLGIPDGAVVDVDDCIWIAHFAAWVVARYDPRGRLMSSIRLPVQNPTCPAFGGERLDTLYVTSGTITMTPEQRAAQPLAGGLFALDVGVAGLPENRFAWPAPGQQARID